jgi:hypothetical protein
LYSHGKSIEKDPRNPSFSNSKCKKSPFRNLKSSTFPEGISVRGMPHLGFPIENSWTPRPKNEVSP